MVIYVKIKEAKKDHKEELVLIWIGQRKQPFGFSPFMLS